MINQIVVISLGLATTVAFGQTSGSELPADEEVDQTPTQNLLEDDKEGEEADEEDNSKKLSDTSDRQTEIASPPSAGAKDPTERIKVTGSRIQKTEVDQASSITISREEAELIAPQGDVAQVPKLFPGTLTRPQESEVAIRGSDPEDSRYFIDDIEVPNIFEPISGTSVVPTRAISDLTFYPGNFAAEYGDSTGGVIKLETRGADIIQPYTEFRLNIPIFFSVYDERPIGDDSSLIVSGRKSTLEPFVAAVAEDGQVIIPYFQDAYVQHYYGGDSFSAKTRFVHSTSGAEVKVFTDRATSEDGTTQFDFKNSYNLFGTDIEFGFWDLNFEIAPFAVLTNSEFSVSDVFFNISVDSFTLPVRKQFRITNNFNIFSGFQVEYSEVNINAIVPERLPQGDAFSDPENTDRIRLNIDTKTRQQAAWSTFEWRVGDLLVAPSIRYFNNSILDKSGYDPRLIARYAVSPSDVIKMGAGQYSQSPQPQETSEGFGNPNLGFITSLHYMLGWETVLFKDWTSDIQVYRKNWRDDVIQDPNPAIRYRSTVTRESNGLEWFFRYSNPGPWFGWLSYTYSETKEIREPGGIEILSDQDATHILNLVGNYKISDTWQIGGRLRHQTGFLFTPVDQVWYQSNTDTYQAVQNPNLVNSERVEDTTAASIFAQKDWKFDSWQITTRFGLEEYQFTRSSPNIDYNYDFSEQQLTTGLPVIPYIEFRAIL